LFLDYRVYFDEVSEDLRGQAESLARQ